MRLSGLNLRPVTPEDHAHNLRVLFSALGRFSPPRMTTAERDAIQSPEDGMMIYNTTTGHVEAREGGAWVDL